MAPKNSKSEHQDPEYKARSVALKLLARREHSRQELRLKLMQRKLAPDVIDPVLDDYEQEGWLDDARFADVYARQRMDLGYGPLRIESELQQRGVFQRPDCLQATTDQQWAERAIEARRRRFGLSASALEWSDKVRQARFLAQRGYTGEQAERALDAREDAAD
ncbi:regulatory protein RecX [Marinobacter halodurans]|uniref:Regulatory protein RecX n=1 Tax=Marinobacter halodurans TaxID=2528979 RepID=A0ABY1ZJI4_9GAMM|nr:regulatory protein RecX [Marinobacter halodurans]TBW53307.1 regulatory protein RecX [Marinobacter halodurans]